MILITIKKVKEYLGKEEIPTCPDFYCCNREIDCVLEREYCGNYTKEIYSGKSIYVKITDIFDISDIMTNYVAFTFKIINIKERK